MSPPASALPPLSPLGTARQRLDPAAALPPGVLAAIEDADLGPETAFVAWQIAAWAVRDLDGTACEPLLSAVAALLVAVGQGSTRLTVDAAARSVLVRAGSVVGAPGERKPLILDGDHLYLHKHHVSERRVAEAIASRAARGSGFPAPAIEAAVAEVAADAVPRPTEEQRAALRAALGRRLAVVSGGPGTGKTTIALGLVRAIVRLGIDPAAIALGAPTGKAANRLDQALAEGLGRLRVRGPADEALAAAVPAARTLHRLLGYVPGARAFAHDELRPLPYRLVVVDESSMIDVALMDRLLRALGPDTALVLLGDGDQLPSVEAGAVFRDLAALAVRLGESHRLGSGHGRGRRILDLATAVRAGTTDAARLVDERASAARVAWDGVEIVPGAEREALLERWYTERIAAHPDVAASTSEVLALPDAGFAPDAEALLDRLDEHHRRFRLLAVTRGRPTGTVALNAWFHRRMGARGAGLVPGEPVLMLRNDYDRELWNGDAGLVVRVREPGQAPRAAAAFKVRGRWVAHHLESLHDSLGLAFALTVHKAQGSEHDDVVLVLPEAPIPLLTRELLYTGLTRSRRAVVVCGAPAVLAAGVANALARSSGIAERIVAPPPG
jgi:exodeoxyribonuclease V alpha subunit